MAQSIRPALRWVFAFFLCFGLTACAGSYDEDADKALSALQQRIDRHIVALITYNEAGTRPSNRTSTPASPGPLLQQSPGWVPGPTYAESVTHYGDVDSAFASLSLRYGIMTSAGIQSQIEALERIRQISQSMADDHKLNNTLATPVLQARRNLFLGAFSGMLNYQRILRPSK